MTGWTMPAGTRCPDCAGEKVVGILCEGRRLAACLANECAGRVFWEPLPADAPADIGTKPQPFRKSCDNCAFHRNSPERQDAEKWQGLVEAFVYQETPFFCHKGVPLQIEGDGYPKQHGFRYPLTPSGRSDTERLRLCAGFIAWWNDNFAPAPVPER